MKKLTPTELKLLQSFPKEIELGNGIKCGGDWRNPVGSSDELGSPHRVQLSRKKGWRIPPNTVIVDRRSKWGNPHHVGYCGVCGVDHTREEAICEFEEEIMDNLWALKSQLEPLRGKNLACWCKENEKCHADILLRLANAPHVPRVANDSKL